MKTLLHFLIFCLITSSLNAQKAKTDTENIKVSRVKYAKKELLEASGYTYMIVDEGDPDYHIQAETFLSGKPNASSQGQLIRIMTGGFDSIRVLNLKHEDVLGTQKPFFHVEMHMKNVLLANNTLKTHNVKSGETMLKMFYYEVQVLLNATMKINYWNHGNKVIADTVNNEYVTMKYPQDFRSNSISPNNLNGFLTANELMASYNQLQGELRKNWKSIEASRWFKNNMKKLNDDYAHQVYKETIVFWTDKNKKGGYDDIVKAANYFQMAMQYVNDNTENKNYINYWSDTIQKMLLTSTQLWENRLKEINMEFKSSDPLLSDDFVRCMHINYMRGLIYSGQWEKAYERLNLAVKSDVGNVVFRGYLNNLVLELENEYFAFKKYKEVFKLVNIGNI
jgi:hypothetical protein